MTRFHHQGEDERKFVRRTFHEIVGRYDLMNRLLSFGMDLRWRRRLLAAMKFHPGLRLLDLACGTGDVARLAGKRANGGLILGADPVPAMLAAAVRKYPQLQVVCCESEALPFSKGSLDAATVAFGVRNFRDLESGLREIHRILVTGGLLGILEFAIPTSGILRGFYSWYLRRVLPVAGMLVNRSDAYRYLAESIHQFPAPPIFKRLLEGTGFVVLNTEQYLGGTVRLYVVRKLSRTGRRD